MERKTKKRIAGWVSAVFIIIAIVIAFIAIWTWALADVSEDITQALGMTAGLLATISFFLALFQDVEF